MADTIEAATFDPWCALDAHRPLGDVMRARKVVYFDSHSAGEFSSLEPGTRQKETRHELSRVPR